VLRNAPGLLASIILTPNLTVEPVWRGPCGVAHIVPSFLEQLVVYDTGLPLVRVGATPGRADFVPHRFYGDGGYVMVSPQGSEVCYSYGISQEVSFDEEVVRGYGVRTVRQFDMTLFGAYVPPLEEFTFYDEGVGPSRDAHARVDTIENHVTRFRELGARKILQMDVEGAEWESLWACPEYVLRSFDHLVVELHGMTNLHSMRRNAAVLAKLNLQFVLVHVHVNNCGMDAKDGLQQQFREVLGYLVPCILEVSYVNRRLVPDESRIARATKRFPTLLDFPNIKAPDVRLNVWPWAEGGDSIGD
jgi:hypothetical protein